MSGKAKIDYNSGSFFLKLYTEDGEMVDMWEIAEEELTLTPAAKAVFKNDMQ